MLGFRDFLNEGGYHVPVVTITKDGVDLSSDKTRAELNKNLSLEMAKGWGDPYSALLKVGKVLSMYGITLPKLILDDELDGEIVVAINQFGHKIGAELDGTIKSMDQQDKDEHYLIYSYGLGEDGTFDCLAVVVTEDELDYMLDEPDDADYEDESGDKDPRQP